MKLTNSKKNELSAAISSVIKKTLNIAVVSDIHLLHGKTPTHHIIESLDRTFPDNAETAALDIIVIAGDLFDNLSQYNNPFIPLIKEWMTRLLRLCKKHNIKLRILEGTPSHDWKQSANFIAMNSTAQIDCDVKYHDKLIVEYFEEYDMWSLWVPDEWRPNPDTTWSEVVELLRANGIDKVDYAFMHGAFHHQIHENQHHTCHSLERYMSIVKKYVAIGHIHTFTVMDRVLAQGSLERLSHGEEGPKGHIRIVDNGPSVDDCSYSFIENKHAMIYVTMDVRGFSIEEIYQAIDKLPDYPMGSRVRFLANKADPIGSIIGQICDDYRFIHWTIKYEKSTNHGVHELKSNFSKRFVPQTITPDNIVGVLRTRIVEKASSDPVAQRALAILEKVVQNVHS